MVKIKLPLALPMVPNYFRLASGGDYALDVALIPDDVLREIGAEWTEALVKHAAARRKNGAR